MLRRMVMWGLWLVIALGLWSYVVDGGLLQVVGVHTAGILVFFTMSYAIGPYKGRAATMAGVGWAVFVLFLVLGAGVCEYLMPGSLVTLNPSAYATFSTWQQHMSGGLQGLWLTGLLFVPFYTFEIVGKIYDWCWPSLVTRAGLATARDALQSSWLSGIPLGYLAPLPQRYVFFGPPRLKAPIRLRGPRQHLDGAHAEPVLYNGDRHLITFGPIGSGKNTMAQTPALLDHRNHASAFVIDPKGQLCAITTRTRQRFLGQKVAVLNPYDVLGIPSASYNPLTHLDPHAVTFAADCERIAEGIVDQPNHTQRTDHFQVSALDYVALLIMWVKLYERDKSLVRVWQIISLPDVLRVEHCVRMAQCDHPAVAEGAARYTSTESREVRDCIQTAHVQAVFLRDPTMQNLLRGGPNEISFAELKRRNMTVFLLIPPTLLQERGKFLRLMLFSAYNEMIHEQTQPAQPVLFMVDEFAQLGHVAMIEQAASIVRDYKVRFWFILQNLPQLKDHYHGIWESFLSSAGVQQVFTPNDQTTAEYFSKRSGRRKVSRVTISRGPGGRSTTTSEAQEPLYTPEDLYDMPNGEQLLICPGVSQGITTARMPYYDHKIYATRADPDPYQMTTEERAAFAERARRGEWLIGLDGIGQARPLRCRQEAEHDEATSTAPRTEPA